MTAEPKTHAEAFLSTWGGMHHDENGMIWRKVENMAASIGLQGVFDRAREIFTFTDGSVLMFSKWFGDRDNMRLWLPGNEPA